MISAKLPHLFYGGDYNPEQWPEEVWHEDVNLMNEAGVNLVSVGIFSWAKLEPRPGEYTFEWLDRVMDLLAAHGIFANLATATASPPAWMARLHPESLPQDADGSRYYPGARQHYCPNGVVYRERAAALTRELAARYKTHPALAMWHVNNEYGCHCQTCYCDVCAAAFRRWLQARYGSLDELNGRWGTAFWSQWYHDWEEILPPRKAPTFPNPAQKLDYARFMNDTILALHVAERDIVKEATPDLPVTTNFMLNFKPLDYWDWAQHVDFTSWDSYPDPLTPISSAAEAACWHDAVRSFGGGKPWVLMEQVTSQVNWRDTNLLKPPGVMRLWSYQAIAHGADGILFFQWRAARGGAEKYHGAMVPHVDPARSRVFAEVKELGRELKTLDAVVGSRTAAAKVALVLDWPSWWAVETESKPAKLNYTETFTRFHRAFYDANIPADFTRADADWLAAGYRFVLAPLQYLMTEAAAENIARFVEGGGVFLTTFFSGIVDENERIHLGGYPALLRDVLGLWVEEWSPHAPGAVNRLEIYGKPKHKAYGKTWSDVMHLTTAHALASFRDDFFAGRPAITRNRYGQGTAYYLATELEPDFLAAILEGICDDLEICPPLKVPVGVEACIRANGAEEFLFLLNHTGKPVEISLKRWKNSTDALTGQRQGKALELPTHGVTVLVR